MPYPVSGVQGWKGKLMIVTSATSDVRPRPSAEVNRALSRFRLYLRQIPGAWVTVYTPPMLSNEEPSPRQQAWPKLSYSGWLSLAQPHVRASHPWLRLRRRLLRFKGEKHLVSVYGGVQLLSIKVPLGA